MSKLLKLYDLLQEKNIPIPKRIEFGEFTRSGKNDRYWFVENRLGYCFGDWVSGESWTLFEEKDSEIHKKEIIKSIKKQLYAQNEQKHRDAEERAKAIIETSCYNPVEPHPYLVSKKIPTDTNMLITRSGQLAVKIIDKNKQLKSLQFISPDGSKRFLSGGKITGNFAIANCFQDPLLDRYVFLCEGYATGLTINYISMVRTICCMSSENIMHVAKKIKGLFSKKIVIFADNDENDQGWIKAKKAAEAINCIAIKPEFPDGRFGDFNDLYILDKSLAKKQILSVVS